MFLSWSGFSDLLVVVLGGSDDLRATSGCSFVIMISSFLGNVDMIVVLGIVDLENE